MMLKTAIIAAVLLTTAACVPYPTRVTCSDGTQSEQGVSWHLSEHKPVSAEYDGSVYTPRPGTTCHIIQEQTHVHS